MHLKSRIPTNVGGQRFDRFTRHSADGWAKGSFISSMKRMSHALEVRRLVDKMITDKPGGPVMVAGDCYAVTYEMPDKTVRRDVETRPTPNDGLA